MASAILVGVVRSWQQTVPLVGSLSAAIGGRERFFPQKKSSEGVASFDMLRMTKAPFTKLGWCALS